MMPKSVSQDTVWGLEKTTIPKRPPDLPGEFQSAPLETPEQRRARLWPHRRAEPFEGPRQHERFDRYSRRADSK